MKYKILDTVDADKFHCWDVTTEKLFQTYDEAEKRLKEIKDE